MGETHTADRITQSHGTRGYRVLAILIIAMLGAPASTWANLPKAEPVPGKEVPDGLVHITSPYAIVVEKSTQRLYLYKIGSELPELVKTYPCSTGKNRGDKTESGDLKTPEGVYFFRMLHRGETLPSKYGVMAFVLDFPNYIDRQKGKGGNGIWLHGLDKPLLPFDTQGCVAMRNEDITELSRFIRLYDTPILITESVDYIEPDRHNQEKQEALQLVTAWRKAWQEKDLQRFLDCYSERYGAGKLNQLGSTKKALNQRYKFISVDLHNLNILKHGSTLIAGFVQDYESDRFSSFGFKKLYLQKNSNELKIVGEDWVQDARFMDVGTTPSEERRICRMLNQWITAWERKDIESYIACYAPDFSSQHMNRLQWKQYKTGINRTTRGITISVDRVKIGVNGSSAMISFAQRYISDSHSDYGRKILHLRRSGDGWKIVREIWEPL